VEVQRCDLHQALIKKDEDGFQPTVFAD